MKTYELIPSPITNRVVIKATSEDGAVSWIPDDPANSDYQAYLAELEKEKEDN